MQKVKIFQIRKYVFELKLNFQLFQEFKIQQFQRF